VLLTISEAYLIGYWIGDGCASVRNGTVQIRLCGNEDDEEKIKLELQSSGYNSIFYYSRNRWTLSPGVKFRELLLENGFELPSNSHTKRIPVNLLSESQDMRWALLSGLIDSDGSVGVTPPKLRYGSCSKALAEDVVLLMESLGIDPHLAEARQHTGYNSGKLFYNVTMRKSAMLVSKTKLHLQKKKQDRLNQIGCS